MLGFLIGFIVGVVTTGFFFVLYKKDYDDKVRAKLVKEVGFLESRLLAYLKKLEDKVK